MISLINLQVHSEHSHVFLELNDTHREKLKYNLIQKLIKIEYIAQYLHKSVHVS